MKGRREEAKERGGALGWGRGKRNNAGERASDVSGPVRRPEHGQWGLAAADPVSTDSMGERTECPLMQSTEGAGTTAATGSAVRSRNHRRAAWRGDGWAGEQGERDKGRRGHSPCVSAVVGQSARFWQHRRQMRRAEGSISET